MIQQPLSPDGVHPPNQFVPKIVSALPCLSRLVRYTLLFVYFFKELISFIGSLDKCHTSVFNTLILCGNKQCFEKEKCCLALYHTIPTLNNSEEEVSWKHCGKRRKCCLYKEEKSYF